MSSQNQLVDADSGAMSVGRMEAFSDGVFGVAVTLLVLNIQLPHLPESAEPMALLNELLRAWPAYLSYFMTFMTLGTVWLGHHQMLKLFRRVDASVQLVNIVFLMFVTLTPFTNALLAEYLPQANKLRIAAIIYGSIWVIMGVLIESTWRYARRADLLKVTLDPVFLKQAESTFQGRGTLFGVAAVLIALVSPPLSITIYLLTALLYMRPLFRVFIPISQPTAKLKP